MAVFRTGFPSFNTGGTEDHGGEVGLSGSFSLLGAARPFDLF